MATNTTKYGLKKPAYSDTADIGDINDNMDTIDSVLDNQAGAVGIVCNGKRCATSASTGQYVILQNSSIPGRNDGLYTAAKAIPANTDLDSSYLTAVSGGGLNALNNKITVSTPSITKSDTISSGGIAQARQSANVVTLALDITMATSSSSYTTIATSEKHPQTNEYFAWVDTSGNTKLGRITLNGEVQVHNPNNNANYMATITFVATN